MDGSGEEGEVAGPAAEGAGTLYRGGLRGSFHASQSALAGLSELY